MTINTEDRYKTILRMLEALGQATASQLADHTGFSTEYVSTIIKHRSQSGYTTITGYAANKYKRKCKIYARTDKPYTPKRILTDEEKRVRRRELANARRKLPRDKKAETQERVASPLPKDSQDAGVCRTPTDRGTTRISFGKAYPVAHDACRARGASTGFDPLGSIYL